MNRKVLGLMVAFLFIASIAFASVAVQEMGVEKGVATTLNVVGLGTSNDGSTFTVGNDIEKATAGDTLVTADSGNVIIYKPATYTATAAVFNLPTASVNMKYAFATGGNSTIAINPEAGDVIQYLTLDAGDRLTSPGATGDSVTLICGEVGYWTISERSGTFTDGGA